MITRNGTLPDAPRARPRAGEASRILVVEDSESFRDVLLELLEGEGYRVEAVPTGEAAMERLRGELFDLVLLDVGLPGMNGLNVLSAAPALQTDAQFVVMTAEAEVAGAVEAMKGGAFEYLEKPLDPDRLLAVMERALRHRRLRRSAARVGAASGTTGGRTDGDGGRRVPGAPGGARRRIIGDSPALRRMLELIDRVAPTTANVLLTGETGSGKELAARAIHQRSRRADGSFVPVSCSALPESLLESELFGHMKGSFTGAVATRKGLVEEAQGGTLFLDEIATIPASMQVKLLRVLEDRSVQRVGGNRSIPVDFRLVSATNMDLEKEVEADRFRSDLFYRLNVFPLRVPPLRERKSDIPVLAEHFRRRFAEANDLEPPAIPPGVLEEMTEYPWPGNVRELENFVERALIVYGGAAAIRFDPGMLRNGNGKVERTLLDTARVEGWTLDRLEREYFLTVLRDVDGNRTRAAEVLGIDRRTVYRKLKRYDVEEGKEEE